MTNIAMKIENVSKKYRLGAIGGGTLKSDLQSYFARKFNKVDPNSKVNDKSYDCNENFLALDNVSFEVKKGEIVGIIGHNGAGKSTLLKLLSRVTTPTSGTIFYNGRIASMLEVGTGFHPELTGRENVYLNGAILGMTKDEVTEKFDKIVQFAEMEKFIDTPVKRYSSGMYVKLAFAVAAHLDSEILIMDEVLAVGDMKFQEKCLGKMDDTAHQDGRTVLYVSHNMNTIRQLCTRCIVLNHGKIIFDGDTEMAISIYSNVNPINLNIYNDCSKMKRTYYNVDLTHRFESIEFLNKEESIFFDDELIKLKMNLFSQRDEKNLCIRMIIFFVDDTPLGMSTSDPIINCRKGQNEIYFNFDSSLVADGTYKVRIALYATNQFGTERLYDVLDCGFSFVKKNNQASNNNMSWNHKVWGHCMLPKLIFVGNDIDE
ncbi:ABC transporter ATP-binding protein [Thomasclavelia cocleata]|jgi:lipopolysaccharide transport system ATP-binding protein|uniref:ABC transporter ATP-binding protein n=1 Tax=Thomasclavelia cocleata TaxID=69824 RepID=UPI00241C4E69|nr:ABC transporter ATP-binding protein [Thomasclavelia cocleata]